MDIRTLLPTDLPAPARRLSGADVEELMERMFAPPSVDHGQIPMNAASRLDSGEMRLALAVRSRPELAPELRSAPPRPQALQREPR